MVYQTELRPFEQASLTSMINNLTEVNHFGKISTPCGDNSSGSIATNILVSSAHPR
jgi:hypothetical protein